MAVRKSLKNIVPIFYEYINRDIDLKEVNDMKNIILHAHAEDLITSEEKERLLQTIGKV